MGSSRGSSGASLSLKTGNKLRRQEMYVKQKRDADKTRHGERFRRKKEEEQNPELRRERLARNQAASIDKKRIWDDVDDDSLGAVVDVAQLKRRRVEADEAAALAEADQGGRRAAEDDEDEDDEDEDDEDEDDEDEDDEDVDSMLGSDDDDDEDDEEARQAKLDKIRAKRAQREPSAAPSTASTNLDLTPSSLALRFPMLFSDEPPRLPKVLVTTGLNSTLHAEAHLLCTLFPNSRYIPRSAHRYGHKYSVREIARFAANRGHTALLVLKEDQKTPTGLTMVHLPEGPTFHFSISNWLEGRKLPGHGNPTNHYPELLLNNFRTPLGMLTAKLFQTLFPPQPEVQGRQVVTIHNQRDYLFVRRHRYVFRDKRATEKSATDADGKDIKGLEDIRAGLQELGPRMTLKLRRVDKGIGRAGSEGEDKLPWEWKAKMEKKRTRFNL